MHRRRQNVVRTTVTPRDEVELFCSHHIVMSSVHRLEPIYTHEKIELIYLLNKRVSICSKGVAFSRRYQNDNTNRLYGLLFTAVLDQSKSEKLIDYCKNKAL